MIMPQRFWKYFTSGSIPHSRLYLLSLNLLRNILAEATFRDFNVRILGNKTGVGSSNGSIQISNWHMLLFSIGFDNDGSISSWARSLHAKLSNGILDFSADRRVWGFSLFWRCSKFCTINLQWARILISWEVKSQLGKLFSGKNGREQGNPSSFISVAGTGMLLQQLWNYKI